MIWIDILGLAFAMVLMVYLMVALIKPECFS